MKVAIVHDWLIDYAGAEKVLEQILLTFPKADLFSICDFVPEDNRAFLSGRTPRTSFIQKIPLAQRMYRNFFALMPLAIEQLDMSDYDVVISSSHAVAKGVITGPDQLHISYVHSPIRYAWDLQHQYLRESGLDRGVKGWVAKWMLHKIRMWDTRTANGVDFFLANSRFIARRIEKVYRREAKVLYPPVDISRFELNEKKEDFYLTASRLVPYKKVDLIVRAFGSMPNRKLIVIGAGPDFKKISDVAQDNVTMLGFQPSEVLVDLMQRAKAFIFAAEEDFGIAPVEAQACGTPVIAFGKGGALETVVDGGEAPTGVFFREQSIESIANAVTEFEESQERFVPSKIRSHALNFSIDIFCDSLKAFVETEYANFIVSSRRNTRPN